MLPDRVTRPRRSLPWVLAGVGAISGIISFVVFFFVAATTFGSAGIFIALPLPGLIFGLIVGGAIGSRLLNKDGLDPGFVAASTIACFLASYLAVAISSGMPTARAEGNLAAGIRLLWHAGAICGLLGSGLVTAYMYAFPPRSTGLRGSALMLIAGAALGAVLFPLVFSIPFIGLAFLFVGWQCGFAAILGLALRARIPAIT